MISDNVLTNEFCLFKTNETGVAIFLAAIMMAKVGRAYTVIKIIMMIMMKMI